MRRRLTDVAQASDLALNSVVEGNSRHFRETTPAMNGPTRLPPGPVIPARRWSQIRWRFVVIGRRHPDTFDAVHGGQQLRLFMGITTNTVSSLSCSTAKAASSRLCFAPPNGRVARIRTNWPDTQILLRADSHYCCPEVLDWCRANGLDYILGVAPKEGKACRFKEFFDGAAS
jgi:Transposase DDE domain group 1